MREATVARQNRRNPSGLDESVVSGTGTLANVALMASGPGGCNPLNI